MSNHGRDSGALPSLDEPERLSHIDPHQTGRLLAEFPTHCRQALALTPSPPLPRRVVRHLVMAGMGGSAVPGDLVRALAIDRLSVPLTVWRDYSLPAFVGPDSLVMVISYSGDTAEAVSALEAALQAGAPAAALASGGRLAELAHQQAIPLVRLPLGLTPRLALGHLFFPLLSILDAVGLPLASEAEREEALRVLEVMGAALAPHAPEARNEAKQLALRLRGQIPLIYGSARTEVAAYRWKTAMEENAKLLAFHGRLPEADHNEIEGWQDPLASGFHAVFLRDPQEDAVGIRRVQVTQELIRARAGGVTEVWPRGEGRLACLLSLIYLGDWVSYYLALLRGVDPWPVPTLDEVKRRLRAAKSP